MAYDGFYLTYKSDRETNERFDRGWADNLESGYSVRCIKDDSTKDN